MRAKLEIATRKQTIATIGVYALELGKNKNDERPSVLYNVGREAFSTVGFEVFPSSCLVRRSLADESIGRLPKKCNITTST
jgi:hypothetical protein